MAYKFINHKSCEFFPCHNGIDVDKFDCIFCYCPLYILGDKCIGIPMYKESHIKDCSNCILPHSVDGYKKILDALPAVHDLMKLISDW